MNVLVRNEAFENHFLSLKKEIQTELVKAMEEIDKHKDFKGIPKELTPNYTALLKWCKENVKK